ncbi:type II toxin-antitoxin system RelE/ParE family toxin [Pseudenterobacter timonensis]|uniref:Type II toxin-antitoxin system RelE/ParE family toxin n=1 Tax=Pseudenterobacter timonensis TaxID=1755099 RepID=A0ABV4ABM3_9ENTR
MKEMIQTETFRRWEQNLKDKRARTLVAARLFRLANGLPGDVKPVGEGVSELRIHYGPGFRLYFTSQGEVLIILLCGGEKSDQKKDIVLAKMLARALKNEEISIHE